MAAHICLHFECARPWCRSPLHRYTERDGLVKALCPWESWWQQCQIPYPPYPLGLVKSCKIYSKANFEFGFFFLQHEPPSITQLFAFCKQDCQGHKSEWQVACGVCCWVCWGRYDLKPHLATLAELPKAPCLKAADSFFSVETAQCFFGALKNFAHTVSQRQWRASCSKSQHRFAYDNDTSPEYLKAKDFLVANDNFVRGELNRSNSDEYWTEMAIIWAQLDGLVAGNAATCGTKCLDLNVFLFLQAEQDPRLCVSMCFHVFHVFPYHNFGLLNPKLS